MTDETAKGDQEDRWGRLQRENAALRAALKPFSDFAGGAVGRPPADTPITMGSRMARRQLTMGDCIRAAEALQPQT